MKYHCEMDGVTRHLERQTPTASEHPSDDFKRWINKKNEHGNAPANWHSFKVLADPMINHRASKKVRYNGEIVPNNPHMLPVTPQDPRRQLRKTPDLLILGRFAPLDLPVPPFKIDENYVGEPPKVEVTIENLNDNIDEEFLSKMIEKYGPVNFTEVCRHPKTERHLGVATLVFKKERFADDCVKDLDTKSVMGKMLKCYLDPYGKSCKERVKDILSERKPLQDKTFASNSVESKPGINENSSNDKGKTLSHFSDQNTNANSFSKRPCKAPPLNTANCNSEKNITYSYNDSNLIVINDHQSVLNDGLSYSGKSESSYQPHQNSVQPRKQVNCTNSPSNINYKKIKNNNFYKDRNALADYEPNENRYDSRYDNQTTFSNYYCENRLRSPNDFTRQNYKQSKYLNSTHDYGYYTWHSRNGQDHNSREQDSSNERNFSNHRSSPDNHMSSWHNRGDSVGYNSTHSGSTYSSSIENSNFDKNQYDMIYKPTSFDPQCNQKEYWDPRVSSWLATRFVEASLKKRVTDQQIMNQKCTVEKPYSEAKHTSVSSFLATKLVEPSLLEVENTAHTPHSYEAGAHVNSESIRKAQTYYSKSPQNENAPRAFDRNGNNREKNSIKPLLIQPKLPTKYRIPKKKAKVVNVMDHTLDLDTRLKMIIDDKNICTPAFMLESMKPTGQEASPKADHKAKKLKEFQNYEAKSLLANDEYLRPLSRTPSPFLSRRDYLTSHDENERSQTKHKKSGEKRWKLLVTSDGCTISGNSKPFSISSLSDNENKGEAEVIENYEASVQSFPTNEQNTSILSSDHSDDSIIHEKQHKRPRISSETASSEKKRSKYLSDSSDSMEKSSKQKLELGSIDSNFEFPERNDLQELQILYHFLVEGLNLEDIRYLKLAYENLKYDKRYSDLIEASNWAAHPATGFPDHIAPYKNKRTGHEHKELTDKHSTGSCRTEGFYKIDGKEKARNKYHLRRSGAFQQALSKYTGSKHKISTDLSLNSKELLREQRNNQRRQLTRFDDEFGASELLRHNQLKFRRKNVMFGKSPIHNWGLFAREDIAAEDMVIEYVGVIVRSVLSDVREKRYEKQGIGSSYLFRIDHDYVIDATKCGNIARFINHSCEPNCYAEVVTVDSESKIVIYSNQKIACGEEITYDYKFPFEDDKIRCLCKSGICRKYLN